MSSADVVARRAVELSAASDQDSAAVEELVDLAGRERRPLEAAAGVFVARLHRRSDDYEATRALHLIHRALAAVGWTTTQIASVTSRRGVARLRARRRRTPADHEVRPQPAAA